MRTTIARYTYRAALLFLIWTGACTTEPGGREPSLSSEPPSLVLISLDTTRADALGAYAGRGSRNSEESATPVLDTLAAAGVLYRRALTPSPLTLPAHASIMTGLDPPEHGVQDNGTSALPADVPTLATRLSTKGFSTAGFVASRVLDRRFGLARGFDVYDDLMTAENLGEHGYPERDAAAVTSAAISWLDSLPADLPFFLWVHYYDPHAPYDPPGAPPSATARQRYYSEVAFMDREIGRLLDALPEQSRGRVVAVVGDHGESLGEHGERGHGIFLYGASLDVPLLVTGSGVPKERVVEDVVSTRRLASTLLRLVDGGPDSHLDSKLPGPPLPGILGAAAQTAQAAVYSETHLPTTAYGWASLRAVSDNRWRLIEAPRLELYDLIDDPGETRNLAAENPDQTGRMRAKLKHLQDGIEPRGVTPALRDPDLDRALRRLGYTGSGGDEGSIDPKVGIRLLEDFEQAKALAASGNHRAARAALEVLVRRNPRNVPFLSHLAGAQLAAGEPDAAVATYRRAIALNPDLEFLHLNLAEAYRLLGRGEEARQHYETVVRLDPRSGSAWIRLAEAAHNAGRASEEETLLAQAVANGTTSGVVHYRLGQVASGKAAFTQAVGHFRRACELIPGWVSPWLALGAAHQSRRQFDEALSSYQRAAEIEPGNPGALLGLARVYVSTDAPTEARRLIARLLLIAPTSPEAGAAHELLTELDAAGPQVSP